MRVYIELMSGFLLAGQAWIYITSLKLIIYQKKITKKGFKVSDFSNCFINENLEIKFLHRKLSVQLSKETFMKENSM